MKFKIFILLQIIFCFFSSALSSSFAQQDNPVLVPDIQTLPVFDGDGSDACWQNIPWQPIDQVWIPDPKFPTVVDSNDYYGCYKIAWSSSTNLLYFLIEIHDDVFISRHGLPNGGELWDNDITEVFIDENTSGGLHMVDNASSNAENAFAYHMYSVYPDDGVVSNDLYADDQLSNSQRIEYSSHLPDFTIKKNGQTAMREFSLIVYNDSYSETNKDAARVQLSVDKIMGLSVAYCENDNNDGRRDNMFGSVAEPSPGNLHWQNADYFGRVKLVSSITSVTKQESVNNSSVRIYPNPASLSANLRIDDNYQGEVSLRLFNILGQEISAASVFKNSRVLMHNFNFTSLSPGVYFLETRMGNTVSCEKLLINKR